MDHRLLGRSGLWVSEIAYGNWLTHGAQIDEEMSTACVRAALDEGISTFDTADIYGGTKAEEVLGQALDGVRRESIVLCTKAFFPVGPGPNDRGLSRKHLTESLHASLRRLRTDYVDVFYAHRFDPGTPLEETLRTLDDFVRQGKILHIGVSEWTADQISHAVRLSAEHGWERIVCNQPQYNMLWRVIEAEVIPACAKEGIGQVVWSPLAQGVLTGKYGAGQAPPDGSRATDQRGSEFIAEYLTQPTLTRVAHLIPLAREAGLTPSQLAIAWTLKNPAVSAAVIGASRPEQVRENVKAAGVRLEADLLRAIDDILGDVIERDPAKTESAT